MRVVVEALRRGRRRLGHGGPDVRRRIYRSALHGLAVVPLFAGYDVDPGAGEQPARIYSYDVTGGRYPERYYHSIGSGSVFAKSALKKLWRPGADPGRGGPRRRARPCTTPPTTTPPPAVPTSAAASTRSSAWLPPTASPVSTTPNWASSRPPSSLRPHRSARLMNMPFYASAEQIMRDRSEYARKGIARGRSVAVLRYADGILFVAENASSALHKVSEIYDRIGFAAVGKYNEFENLRVAGIRLADLRGYSYDRRDVTARSLANAYAQTLGAIFTEQQKPYEVELCVAEVGASAGDDQIYRLSYDGTIADEPEFLVMGGQAEAITASLRQTFRDGLDLAAAVAVAVHALGSVGGERWRHPHPDRRAARGRRARPHPDRAHVQAHDRARADPPAAQRGRRTRPTPATPRPTPPPATHRPAPPAATTATQPTARPQSAAGHPVAATKRPSPPPATPPSTKKTPPTTRRPPTGIDRVQRRILGIENEYGVTCTFHGHRRLSPGRGRPLPVPPGGVVGAFLQRLPAQRGPALPRRRQPPRVRDAGVRRRRLPGHPRQGGRAGARGPARSTPSSACTTRASTATSTCSRTTPTRPATPTAATRTTWSGAPASSARLADVLIPFLVTRQLICGAGKVLQTPRGAVYCLSQRAEHIWEGVSSATTRSRPIINTRDEPHADAERYRRLHVIVGDSNMNECTTMLKVGSADLVLRMIEAGVAFRDLALENPIRAIREISHDLTGTKPVKLASGRTASALDIQRDYLARAEDFVKQGNAGADDGSADARRDRPPRAGPVAPDVDRDRDQRPVADRPGDRLGDEVHDDRALPQPRTTWRCHRRGSPSSI